MYYVQIPYSPETINLSHAHRSVLLQLCILRFHFVGTKKHKEFHCTDRALAASCSCSTRTVYLAKKKLKELKFINFFIGPRNTTYYEILK